MKGICTVCAIVSMAFFVAGAAIAGDCVDIGVETGGSCPEQGHNLVGWGPIEPLTSGGGTYGGIDQCRAVWYDTGDPGNPDPPWATVDLNFDEDFLWLRHLEGLADDGFDIYINDTWVYSHADIIVGQEVWIWTIIDVSGYSGTCTVKLQATGEKWSGFSTYGQMCFAFLQVAAFTIPVEENTWGSIKALYR